MHIAELSTAVVKVDIKLISASLTQKQCLHCETPPLTHVEIPRPCNATELNNDGMIKLGDVYSTKQNRFYDFLEKDLINDNSSFRSHIRLAIFLQYHVFPFEKLLLNVRLFL